MAAGVAGTGVQKKRWAKTAAIGSEVVDLTFANSFRYRPPTGPVGYNSPRQFSVHHPGVVIPPPPGLPGRRPVAPPPGFRGPIPPSPGLAVRTLLNMPEPSEESLPGDFTESVKNKGRTKKNSRPRR